MTLRDAATYITKLPKAEQDLRYMAGRGRAFDPGRRDRRLDHAGEHRRAEGATPRRGAGDRKETHRATQQFNTTTSMGRLTLNVLLSFAQFEREVTSERIRDKIAASKRKGLWVGGNLPFDYENEGQQNRHRRRRR
jgi:hypothetical protein